MVWGCFAAGLFLFFLGLPILMAAALGDCFGDPVDCGNKQVHVLETVVALLVVALILFWLTSGLVRRSRNRSRP